MLVLSRYKNQDVCIGNDVRVRVIDVKGDRVRIGIDAPRDVTVHRAEIAALIRQAEASKQKETKR